MGAKLERQKKEHQVSTYREILAFLNGKTLDEIDVIRESGKVGYQRFINILIFAAMGALISIILGYVKFRVMPR